MKTWKFILWILAHVILGEFSYKYPMITTFHAYFILGLGIFWAIRGNAANLMYTGAYIVGAEVLWRMTDAKIFWEFAKYSISFVFMIYLALKGRKKPFLPILYFALLLPSTVFLPILIPHAERINYGDISFNLSGPLCLMVCVLFFSKTVVTRAHLVRIFQYLILPCFSVVVIAREYTAHVEKVTFQEASNMITSGGFGPNQVSSMLGLGALLCFLILVSQRTGVFQKAIFISGIGILGAQSALTFSRSGLYFAALSGLFGLSYFLRKRKNLSRFVFAFSLLGIIGTVYIWPQLNSFTDGAVQKRFQDTKLTHREEIWREDMGIFQKNILFGVGPGQSKRKRVSAELWGIVGHIEPTRMLSEHGIFGLFSLMILILMAWRAVFTLRDQMAKGYALSFIIWSFAFISINGMRISAPSFLFGLASAVILTDLTGLFKSMQLTPGAASEISPSLKSNA